MSIQQCRLSLKRLDTWMLNASYNCHRCAIRNKVTRLQTQRQRGSLASSTAVNAKAQIAPTALRLHRALTNIRRDVASYVNTARLDLALRSLESEKYIIRTAILGLTSRSKIRDLLRLLLVDVLLPKEPWEDRIEDLYFREHSALLIRFDEELRSEESSDGVHKLYIPSATLRDLNAEIFLSSLHEDARSSAGHLRTQEPKTVVKTPSLSQNASILESFRNQRLPAHRAVIAAHGIEGSFLLGRSAAVSLVPVLDPTGVIIATLDLDGLCAPDSFSSVTLPATIPVNTTAGLLAIDAYRENSANSSIFHRNWIASGIPALNEWFRNTSSAPSGLPTVFLSFVKDVLEETLTSIETAPQLQLPPHRSDASLEKIDALQDAVREWAANSHTELQRQLETVSSGKSWAKLTWWKLILRVDDVGEILSGILQRLWLKDAEMQTLQLSGRFYELGLIRKEDLQSARSCSQNGAEVFQREETPRHVDSTMEAHTAISRTWPNEIAVSRADLLATTVPAMAARAQQLLLNTLASSAISAAVSAFLYTAFEAISIFETTGLAAFGVLWSLRRLQRQWEAARTSWRRDIRESGRRALRSTEEGMKMVLRSGQGRLRETCKHETASATNSRAVVLEALEALDAMATGD